MSIFAARETYPSIKFAQIGDSVAGRIIDIGEVQQREFGTNALLTWPDGNPRMQGVITLETPGDGGTRTLWTKGRLLTAVRTAVHAAGASDLEVGGALTVRYVANESTRAGSAAKVYEVAYQPPTPDAPMTEAEKAEINAALDAPPF